MEGLLSWALMGAPEHPEELGGHSWPPECTLPLGTPGPSAQGDAAASACRAPSVQGASPSLPPHAMRRLSQAKTHTPYRPTSHLRAVAGAGGPAPEHLRIPICSLPNAAQRHMVERAEADKHRTRVVNGERSTWRPDPPQHPPPTAAMARG